MTVLVIAVEFTERVLCKSGKNIFNALAFVSVCYYVIILSVFVRQLVMLEFTGLTSMGYNSDTASEFTYQAYY
jgi:hypothetical protein